MNSIEDIQTRLQRLRDRIDANETSSASQAESLGERLLQLRNRVFSHSTGNYSRAEELEQGTKKAEGKGTDSIDGVAPNPFDTLIASFEEQLITLGKLEATGSVLESVCPQARLDSQGVRRLIELAVGGIRGLPLQYRFDELSPILAGFTELHRRTQHTVRRLSQGVALRDRRSELVDEIEKLHQQIVFEAAIPIDALQRIAQRINQGVDERYHPDFDFSPCGTPNTMIARHAINVAELTSFLALGDANWASKREVLVITALVQDAGMLKVSEDLLLQATPLTDEQKGEVERHAHYGSYILEQIEGFPRDIALAAANHHERLDGSGYPSAKREGDLCRASRLLAVADAYVAARSPRLHRPAAAAKVALTDVLGEAENGRLDPFWARRLLNLSLYPVGSLVELSTGEFAEVIATQDAVDNPSLSVLPVVRIRVDRAGKPVYLPIYRNLAQRSDCRVVRLCSDAEAAEVLAEV